MGKRAKSGERLIISQMFAEEVSHIGQDFVDVKTRAAELCCN